KAEYEQGLASDQAVAAAKAQTAQAAAAEKQDYRSQQEAKEHAARHTKNSDYVWDYRRNAKGGWEVFKAGKKYVKPGSQKQPTNTGPYYIDPTTKKPRLKPGYHTDATGNVVKDLAPTKPPKPGKPTIQKRNGVSYQWYPDPKSPNAG